MILKGALISFRTAKLHDLQFCLPVIASLSYVFAVANSYGFKSLVKLGGVTKKILKLLTRRGLNKNHAQP